MSKKANPAVIGAFVIGATLLAVVAILVFGSGKLFRTTDTLVTYFDGTLRGLRVGANVTFRGVKVGEVIDVSVTVDARELDTRELEFSIPVVIELYDDKFIVVGAEDDLVDTDEDDDDLQTLIERGLRAQLNIQSMVTGLLEVEMDFFPDTEAVYRNNGLVDLRELPTIPSTTQQLMARLRTFMDRLQDFDFESLVDNVSDTAKGLDDLVNSPQLKNSLDGIEKLLTSEDTQALAASLRQTLAKVDATMDSARVMIEDADEGMEPIVAELLAALEEVSRAANNAQETLASIREGITGQSNAYFRIANALQEVENAARAFRVLADYLERHPEAILRGKPEP